MKLPSSLRSFVPTAPTTPAEPFDEMNLSDRQIACKLRKLRTKGYFTIPVSGATSRFLTEQATAIPSQGLSMRQRDFKGSTFEQTTTSLATRVVSRLAPGTAPLDAQEFQVRKPAACVADDWHQDREPKVLTCITTLEGTGTQFVLPAVARKKFTPISGQPINLMPIAGEQSIRKDIRTTKAGKFYVFAARAVTDPQIPKLVHRAPGEEGRAIFLARWTEIAPTEAGATRMAPAPQHDSKPD